MNVNEKCNDEILYWQMMVSSTQYVNENLEAEERLIATKKFIALGGEVRRDGNMFCALIGEMPVDYCAGFKITRAEAIQECMHNWYNEKAK